MSYVLVPRDHGTTISVAVGWLNVLADKGQRLPGSGAVPGLRCRSQITHSPRPAPAAGLAWQRNASTPGAKLGAIMRRQLALTRHSKLPTDNGS